MNEDTVYDDDGNVVGVLEEEAAAPEPQALDLITQAEVDVAISTAKRWPRNLAKFKDRTISMACLDQETAEECIYSLRREGKTIQGPSVRLAEIALSAFQNVRAGARMLGETEDGKRIRALGVCHDLENNVYVAVEVQRRITKRDGSKYGDDMIAVTAAAAGSIALRNATFRVIPRAMLKPAFNRAKAVAVGDAKTLKERREDVFARLRGLNPLITNERILASIERPSIEEVTLEDLAHLIGLGTAIRDGAQSIEEAFPELAPKRATVESVGAPTEGQQADAAIEAGLFDQKAGFERVAKGAKTK